MCLGLPNARGDHRRSLKPRPVPLSQRDVLLWSKVLPFLPSGCNPKGAWSQGYDMGGS